MSVKLLWLLQNYKRLLLITALLNIDSVDKSREDNIYMREAFDTVHNQLAALFYTSLALYPVNKAEHRSVYTPKQQIPTSIRPA